MDPNTVEEGTKPLVIIAQSHFLRRYKWIYRDLYIQQTLWCQRLHNYGKSHILSTGKSSQQITILTYFKHFNSNSLFNLYDFQIRVHPFEPGLGTCGP